MDIFYGIHIKTRRELSEEWIKAFFINEFSAIELFKNNTKIEWLDSLEIDWMKEWNFRSKTLIIHQLNGEKLFFETFTAKGRNFLEVGAASRDADSLIGDKLEFFVDWFYERMDEAELVVATFDASHEDVEKLFNSVLENDNSLMHQYGINYFAPHEH